MATRAGPARRWERCLTTARGRPAKDGLHNTSPAATIPDADGIALWRALADGYRAGCEHGYAIGYAAAEADMAAAWRAVADPVARGGPEYAELEERRWGPEGREHFGDPRPGDFPGRQVTAA